MFNSIDVKRIQNRNKFNWNYELFVIFFLILFIFALFHCWFKIFIQKHFFATVFHVFENILYLIVSIALLRWWSTKEIFFVSAKFLRAWTLQENANVFFSSLFTISESLLQNLKRVWFWWVEKNTIFIVEFTIQKHRRIKSTAICTCYISMHIHRRNKFLAFLNFFFLLFPLSDCVSVSKIHLFLVSFLTVKMLEILTEMQPQVCIYGCEVYVTLKKR